MQFFLEIAVRLVLSAVCVIVAVPVAIIVAAPLIFFLSLRDDSIIEGMKARFKKLIGWVVELAGIGGSSIP